MDDQQNKIDSMKKECLQEYPMPYFSGSKEEMAELFEQLNHHTSCNKCNALALII